MKKLHPTALLTFEQLDVGDIVGVEGRLMITRKGELSIETSGLRILTKALRPLPEKWHGLRCFDAISSEICRSHREYEISSNNDPRLFGSSTDFDAYYLESKRLYCNRFMEGECPSIYNPYNSMDMDLFMRVAPELNLKRLVVGGLNRVYESIDVFGMKIFRPNTIPNLRCWNSTGLTQRTPI